MSEEDLETPLEVVPELLCTVVQPDTLAGQLMKFGHQTPPKGPDPRRVAATAIYDGLATLYNDAEVGALLVVSLPNRPSLGNLHRVLSGRGLTETDYTLFRARFDAEGNRYPVKERPLVLEKRTSRWMRMRAKQAQSMGREVANRAMEHVDEAERLLHARSLTPEQLKRERVETETEAAKEEGSLLDPMITAPGSALTSPLDEAEAHQLGLEDIPPPKLRDPNDD